ncbi:MAG: aldo/keto reductase, partial [Candidatus Electrothrix sp. AR4]|nr:aldo/keto reductase [Candidatus Electrothrix sp. AR4]
QCTPAQVLISWAIHRKTAVIPKSVNSERMRQNLAATELSLQPKDMRDLAGLDCNLRYVSGAFWAIEDDPHMLENLREKSPGHH